MVDFFCVRLSVSLAIYFAIGLVLNAELFPLVCPSYVGTELGQSGKRSVVLRYEVSRD